MQSGTYEAKCGSYVALGKGVKVTWRFLLLLYLQYVLNSSIDFNRHLCQCVTPKYQSIYRGVLKKAVPEAYLVGIILTNKVKHRKGLEPFVNV